MAPKAGSIPAGIVEPKPVRLEADPIAPLVTANGLAAAPAVLAKPDVAVLAASVTGAIALLAPPPTPAAPASDAPPKAWRPAIRPLLRSPVSAACPAPTPAASIHGATPGISIPAAPIRVGSNLPSQPASGRPVLGLVVRSPPNFCASPRRLFTSPGVMCTSMESSPRPCC
jgi:hypothetical protein